MPRNGSGVFSYTAGSTATTGQTALASTHNIPLADILADANAVRPVVAGGTGASSAAGALTALGAAAAADALAGDTSPTLAGHLAAAGFDITGLGTLSLTEQAAANADVAGDGQLWVKTATPNELWFTDDAGTDFQIGTLSGTETFTNKTLTSPVLNTGVSGTAVLDEDDMASDSATKLATQQSIKAYVDALDTALADVAIMVAEADCDAGGIMTNDYGFSGVVAAGGGSATYRYTYTFTTTQPDANYRVHAIQTGSAIRGVSVYSKTTTGFEIEFNNGSNDNVQQDHEVMVIRRGTS